MEFIDLKQQYQKYKEEIHAEIDEVLQSARFISGPAIQELESALSAYLGAKHSIGCSSGTDALLLGLMAKNVGPGDEIIVPDFTFIATAEVVSLLGATPVFVDINDDTLNIDPAGIEAFITQNTKGIIPVSLYGQCADLDTINEIALKKNLWVMEDAAQSFGAEYKGKKSCSLTELATTSFFPAKPLGAYGDGGAVFTDDDGLAAQIRCLLNHGQDKRYHHSMIGTNARLDTLQAAVLKVKLRHFDEEMAAKRNIADMYTERLSGIVRTPTVLDHNESVWAQYTVRSEKRDSIVDELKSAGIPVAVHYPMPLHTQKAFEGIVSDTNCYPVSAKASQQVFSLPMHPFLTEQEIDSIVAAISRSA